MCCTRYLIAWISLEEKRKKKRRTLTVSRILGRIHSLEPTFAVCQVMEMNSSNTSTISRSRQVCWRLPSKFDPSIESLENQFLHFLSIVRIRLSEMSGSNRTSSLVARLHSKYSTCLHRWSRDRDQYRLVRVDLYRLLFLRSVLSLHRRPTIERK